MSESLPLPLYFGGTHKGWAFFLTAVVVFITSTIYSGFSMICNKSELPIKEKFSKYYLVIIVSALSAVFGLLISFYFNSMRFAEKVKLIFLTLVFVSVLSLIYIYVDVNCTNMTDMNFVDKLKISATQAGLITAFTMGGVLFAMLITSKWEKNSYFQSQFYKNSVIATNQSMDSRRVLMMG